MSKIFAILSPAKTLKMDSESCAIACTKSRFKNKSDELVSVLSQFTVSKLSELMSISKKLSTLNVERWKHYGTKTNPSGPAAMSFRGHVYQGFEAWSLDKESIQWAQNHVRILSGLYGLLRPLDSIQPYRLEMGTKLKTSTANNLYEYWSDSITKLLIKDMQKVNAACLIDLASKEYSRALDFSSLGLDVIAIDFLQKKGNATRFISFDAKTARGLMARWMSIEKPSSVSDIKEFNLNGYTFDSSKSSDLNFVFTRKVTAKRRAG